MSATRRQRRKAKGDRPALILCARVGGVAHVPTGATTADCSRCGHAVWIAPETLEIVAAMAGRLRRIIWCDQCSGYPRR